MRDVHALIGAYVMDAVSAADRSRFERHLVTCAECREDVRGMREATARLGEAAAVPPRPALRDQTLRAAQGIRQLPPLVSTGGNGHWRARLRRPGRSHAVKQQPGPDRSPARRWLTGVAATVAAALAVTAIVLGVHLTAMNHRLSAAQQSTQSIGAILGAGDATTLTASIRTGGVATVVMSHRAHALVFVATGLPALPASRRYELWLMSPARVSPAGMLPPERHGMTGPMVVGRLSAGERLGLTVEPAAGAARPTSAPLVVVTLSP